MRFIGAEEAHGRAGREVLCGHVSQPPGAAGGDEDAEGGGGVRTADQRVGGWTGTSVVAGRSAQAVDALAGHRGAGGDRDQRQSRRRRWADIMSEDGDDDHAWGAAS